MVDLIKSENSINQLSYSENVKLNLFDVEKSDKSFSLLLEKAINENDNYKKGNNYVHGDKTGYEEYVEYQKDSERNDDVIDGSFLKSDNNHQNNVENIHSADRIKDQVKNEDNLNLNEDKVFTKDFFKNFKIEITVFGFSNNLHNNEMNLLKKSEFIKNENGKYFIDMDKLPKKIKDRIDREGLLSIKSNGKNIDKIATGGINKDFRNIEKNIKDIIFSYFNIENTKKLDLRIVKNEKDLTFENSVQTGFTNRIFDKMKGGEKKITEDDNNNRIVKDNEIKIRNFEKDLNGVISEEKNVFSQNENNFDLKNSGKIKNRMDILKEQVKESVNEQIKDEFSLKTEKNGETNIFLNQKNSEIKNENNFSEKLRVWSENKIINLNDIVNKTKVVLGNEKLSFSTFVRPEELGRVDFKFEVKDGKVSGKVVLQNKDAYDIFRNSVEDIRAVFQRANVELEKLDIILAGNKEFQGFDFLNQDFSGANSFSYGDNYKENGGFDFGSFSNKKDYVEEYEEFENLNIVSSKIYADNTVNILI